MQNGTLCNLSFFRKRESLEGVNCQLRKVMFLWLFLLNYLSWSCLKYEQNHHEERLETAVYRRGDFQLIDVREGVEVPKPKNNQQMKRRSQAVTSFPQNSKWNFLFSSEASDEYHAENSNKHFMGVGSEHTPTKNTPDDENLFFPLTRMKRIWFFTFVSWHHPLTSNQFIFINIRKSQTLFQCMLHT